MIGVRLNGDLIREIRRKILHMSQEKLAGLSETVEGGAYSFSERSLRAAERQRESATATSREGP